MLSPGSLPGANPTVVPAHPRRSRMGSLSVLQQESLQDGSVPRLSLTITRILLERMVTSLSVYPGSLLWGSKVHFPSTDRERLLWVERGPQGWIPHGQRVQVLSLAA